MRFEDSKLSQTLNYKKITLPSGDFYFFDKFVISEINGGIHFDWDQILVLIGVMIDFYGKDLKIAYISNRINAYSFEPQLWVKFEKEYNFIIASAVVVYNDLNYVNASLEKKFSSTSIKRCGSLEIALHWVNNLKEFKES